MTGAAGNGLGASNGVLAVGAQTNGGISVGSSDIGLDLNDLSAASVDVTADSIAIIDDDDSDSSKKESIVDFVAAIAGAGTQPSNGQITVAGAGAFPLSDTNQNLSGGINFFSGAIGSARTLTLPAASDDYKGIQFIVKAATNVSNTLTVTITASSDDQVRIDGSTDPVVLESPGAAVTFVGLGATHGWAII